MTNTKSNAGLFNAPLAPVITKCEYKTMFGFVKERHQVFECPTCGTRLWVSKKWHPNLCLDCFQPLDYSQVTFEEPELISFDEKGYNEFMRKIEEIKNACK